MLGCVALVAASLYGGLAFAGIGKDYDGALLKIEKKHYADAVPLLEGVIEEVPASRPRIRLYGMRFSPYTPRYWLGVAYFNLGDCESALRHWQAEARFQVLSTSHAETMEHDSAQCRELLAKQGQSLPSQEDGTQPQADVASPALQTLIDRYLLGEYEAAAAFDPDTLATEERAQGWLYRAASQYILHVLSDGSDEGTTAAVQDSLAKAMTGEVKPTIDPRRFPPKFLRLLDAGIGSR